MTQEDPTFPDPDSAEPAFGPAVDPIDEPEVIEVEDLIDDGAAAAGIWTLVSWVVTAVFAAAGFAWGYWFTQTYLASR